MDRPSGCCGLQQRLTLVLALSFFVETRSRGGQEGFALLQSATFGWSFELYADSMIARNEDGALDVCPGTSIGI